MPTEPSETELFIDSLLGLPQAKLLTYIASFKPSAGAALQAAAGSAGNDPAKMARLLARGDADVDGVDDRMWTPLMTAAAAGNGEVIGVLLANGANPLLQNEEGDAPLHLALKAGHGACVALLLQRGCDANVRTRDGTTPLMMAAAAGLDVAAMRMLLDAGRSGVDLTDEAAHMTALMHAARGGHFAAARLLVERGADAGATDAHGRTPLHHASGIGALEVVAMLLQAGGSEEAEDGAGVTPRGAAAAACAAGGSLRHLGVVEVLEAAANGEDLASDVLEMAEQPDSSLPGPRSVFCVLHEVRWARPGVAMQVHEDEGVRKPRPFSNEERHIRGKAGSGAAAADLRSDYGVKIPRSILERLYSRQRRDENRRAALTKAGPGLFAQPGLPQTSADAHGTPFETEPDEQSSDVRVGPGRAAGAAAAVAEPAGDGDNAPQKPARTTADAVRIALSTEAAPDIDALVATVSAITQMRRGKLPAETLPPKSQTALLSRAMEHISLTVARASTGDDTDGMLHALRGARTQHARLVDALGGGQLPAELQRRMDAATYECEARRAAVNSALRRMNSAWRGGIPVDIAAAIDAATTLSLPQVAKVGDSGLLGSLAQRAHRYKERHGGLMQAQQALKESCERITDRPLMDAAALAHNMDVIAMCGKYEATGADSPEFRRLQAAVAEVYAMAEEDLGKENAVDTDANANTHIPSPTQTQMRMKMETRSLRAQRQVETRSAEVAKQREASRDDRLETVQAQLAHNRLILEEHQRNLRASIASEEDRTLHHQMALSAERAERLTKYAERESKAAASKDRIVLDATAKLVSNQASREQRYVLRSIEAESQEEASATSRRVAQQRRDETARRRESMDAERRSKFVAKLSSKMPLAKDAAARGVAGAAVGVTGTAAFLGTSRAQRESAVIGGASSSRSNTPYFYTRPVSAARAADLRTNAVWKETAFGYPEALGKAGRRQVAGKWVPRK